MSQQYPQPQKRYSPHVQPNMQQHIPPQWQGKPPVIEPFTYPGKPQPERRRPPYPSHLTRFPSGLFPRQKRRGRGHSLMFYIHLGNHPIALLIGLYFTIAWLAVLIDWVALVVGAWLLWCAVVTIGWGCHVAVSAALGGRRGRI